MQKIVIFVIYRSFGLQKRLGIKNFVIPPTLVLLRRPFGPTQMPVPECGVRMGGVLLSGAAIVLLERHLRYTGAHIVYF